MIEQFEWASEHVFSGIQAQISTSQVNLDSAYCRQIKLVTAMQWNWKEPRLALISC